MNINNIFTIDDFTDTFKFDETQLKSYQWIKFSTTLNPWEVRVPFHSSTNKWEEDTPQICKDAYEFSLQAFKKINPNCVIKDLVSCFIHKQTPETFTTEIDIHRDIFEPDMWACVMYVQGNGPTEFYKTKDESSFVKKIDALPGRLAIFPCGYWHKPNAPTSGVRYVVAFQFRIENLVESMNGVKPLCQCGLSETKPYCDGNHNIIFDRYNIPQSIEGAIHD